MIYCGIDPGAETGLVCVALPIGATRLQDGRLVGFTTITAGSVDGDMKPQRRARLFHRIREQLVAWRVTMVVLEEPWDAMPSWRTRTGGTNTKGGSSRGTLFGIGAHYACALCAASDLPWDVAVASYPVTSEKEKRKQTAKGWRTKPARLGWMQRHHPQIPAHAQTVNECAVLLARLKQLPADGVLPSRAELERVENDNVYMAVGVLNFHLDRERGAL